ncbi:hypothetical protein SAMN05192558_103315 [Actinokineospora alba]|uniref:Uncharacterized protein n=1 Tax=Actinokineospora alba TaxID=504798 RepID=A0A1H0K3L9_9PSEU|nr:hypothetical protein [Actinokineospora alba]SDH91778.1 hypothetical protein SAMN05421871_102734 [Actinokineospora alba]SDO50301.1 hypothetical protein SAMN05192558_103315 [Actinokineospora alba]
MALTTAEIETRIRSAYFQLARKRQDWVGMVALRALLTDISRDEIDDTLRHMSRTDGRRVFLAPESCQIDLTQADRDAAVRFGGDDNHLLVILPD